MAVNFNVMDLGKAGLLEPERMGYKDSIEIIQDESLKVQKSFVKIGWYLKHIRDNELYKEDGYANINECAANQLGYSQSTTSRFIKICERFSKNGNSPELDEKYAGFDKSQMIEMLPMEPEEIERVTSDMTVTEIRAVKNERIVNKPDDGEIRLFCRYFLDDISEKDRAGLKGYMIDQYGKRHAGGSAGDMDCNKIIYQCSPRGISINGSNEITWAYFVKRVRELEELIPGSCFCTVTVKEETDILENELPGQTSIEKDFPDATPHINDVSNTNAALDELEHDSREGVIDAAYRELPEEVEVADPSQSLGVTKPDKEQREYLDVSESDRGEDNCSEQPELPLLKNDKQRIEWLKKYKDWGMWYRDENIDVNYYKFDFSDGSRLIVDEYPQRHSYYSNQRKDECFYHLLEKNRHGYGESYDESYRHNPDCVTYLIGFLKNIQKAYK